MSLPIKYVTIIALLIILLVPLLARAEEATEPINPTFMKLGKGVFQMLLTYDAGAYDCINWDYFFLDNEDISEEIYESTDAEEEELIKQDVLKYIFDLLHYPGDENDTYAEWVDDMMDSGDYYLMCSNKKRNVEMLFEQDDVEHLVLKEMSVFNLE